MNITPALGIFTLAGTVCAGTLRPEFQFGTIADPTGEVHDLDAGDLNGDGIVDLAAAIKTTGRVVWYERFGTVFAERFVAQIDLAETIEVADLNGDGHGDLLVSSADASLVRGYISDGSQPPTFTELTVDALAGATDAHAVDIDNDGDTDVLATSNWYLNVTLYRNEGNDEEGLPIFSVEAFGDEPGSPTTVTAGDVNEDGFPDVIVGSGNLVRWYQSIGGEAFVAASSWAVAGVTEIEVIDYDGNATDDLLVASSGFDDGLTLFRSTGGSSPAFIKNVMLTNAGGPNHMSVADLDEDGNLDVALPGFWSGDASVCWGPAGDPPFSLLKDPILTGFASPLSICIADFDGDSDDDIAIGGIQIQFAENMLIPPAPVIVRTPDSVITEAQVPVELMVEPTGIGPFMFQWLKDGAPLADSSRLTGSQSDTLTIDTPRTEDTGRYSCVVSNTGGSTTTEEATVAVTTCGGDANSDGYVDFADLNILLDRWATSCSGGK